jgi:hypothetical protein
VFFEETKIMILCKTIGMLHASCFGFSKRRGALLCRRDEDPHAPKTYEMEIRFTGTSRLQTHNAVSNGKRFDGTRGEIVILSAMVDSSYCSYSVFTLSKKFSKPVSYRARVRKG